MPSLRSHPAPDPQRGPAPAHRWWASAASWSGAGSRPAKIDDRGFDVTAAVRGTGCRFIRRAVEKGATVLAIPLPGFQGLLEVQTQTAHQLPQGIQRPHPRDRLHRRAAQPGALDPGRAHPLERRVGPGGQDLRRGAGRAGDRGLGLPGRRRDRRARGRHPRPRGHPRRAQRDPPGPGRRHQRLRAHPARRRPHVPGHRPAPHRPGRPAGRRPARRPAQPALGAPGPGPGPGRGRRPGRTPGPAPRLGPVRRTWRRAWTEAR